MSIFPRSKVKDGRLRTAGTRASHLTARAALAVPITVPKGRPMTPNTDTHWCRAAETRVADTGD